MRKKDYDLLRKELAEREYYSLSQDDIIEILLYGTKGYYELEDDEIDDLVEQIERAKQ
jgi:hypothetical protein